MKFECVARSNLILCKLHAIFSLKSYVECLNNKGTQVRSLTRSKILLKGVAKVGEFTTFLWKVANVKDICGSSLHTTRLLRVSLSPDDISHDSTLVTFFSHKSVGISRRSRRFDANFGVEERSSSLANYRRYNNATPIKSNDSFRATLVGLSVSGVGGEIVLATKQQQLAVRGKEDLRDAVPGEKISDAQGGKCLARFSGTLFRYPILPFALTGFSSAP